MRRSVQAVGFQQPRKLTYLRTHAVIASAVEVSRGVLHLAPNLSVAPASQFNFSIAIATFHQLAIRDAADRFLPFHGKSNKSALSVVTLSQIRAGYGKRVRESSAQAQVRRDGVGFVKGRAHLLGEAPTVPAKTCRVTSHFFCPAIASTLRSLERSVSLFLFVRRVFLRHGVNRLRKWSW
jgi:hypothetical protein